MTTDPDPDTSYAAARAAEARHMDIWSIWILAAVAVVAVYCFAAAVKSWL